MSICDRCPFGATRAGLTVSVFSGLIRQFVQSQPFAALNSQLPKPMMRRIRCAIGIGADHIMFAVGYPWDARQVGGSLFASVAISAQDRAAISRGNAVRSLSFRSE